MEEIGNYERMCKSQKMDEDFKNMLKIKTLSSKLDALFIIIDNFFEKKDFLQLYNIVIEKEKNTKTLKQQFEKCWYIPIPKNQVVIYKKNTALTSTLFRVNYYDWNKGIIFDFIDFFCIYILCEIDEGKIIVKFEEHDYYEFDTKIRKITILPFDSKTETIDCDLRGKNTNEIIELVWDKIRKRAIYAFYTYYLRVLGWEKNVNLKISKDI